MELNEYQELAKETIVYPQRTLSDSSMGASYETGVLYNALNLASEAGEVAGKVGKAIRKDTEVPEETVIDEIGDVLYHVATLAYELGYSLEDVAQRNVDKLKSRQARGVLIGEGDNR
jgi:NTP pyrophosphatase (non-canonical NTP hydrolase)